MYNERGQKEIFKNRERGYERDPGGIYPTRNNN